MKTLLIALIAITASIISPTHSLAADYQYSQYCLRGFRDQFKLDEHYPEYVDNCGEGEEFRGNIDDPELFILAGEHYLKGEPPTSINWELQPLLKYLFGTTLYLGLNPLLVQYLFLLGIIYLLFQSARQLSPRFGWLIGGLSSILLVSDGLVREQLSLTYLDIGQTFFISLFIYSLSKQKGDSRISPLIPLSLGLVALSKSFSIGILVALYGFVYLFLVKRQSLALYLRSLYLAIITYILGYTAFFFAHPLVDFFTLHLDIIRLYSSYASSYPKGEVFRIIFTGNWRTWYGDKGLIPAPNWSILWAAGVVGSLYAGIRRCWQDHPLLALHLLWILLYLFFVSLRLVFPRYLVPILPSMYLILAYLPFTLINRSK